MSSVFSFSLLQRSNCIFIIVLKFSFIPAINRLASGSKLWIQNPTTCPPAGM